MHLFPAEAMTTTSDSQKGTKEVVFDLSLKG